MANKQAKRIAAVVMAAAMVFTVAPLVTPQAVTAEAAAKKTVKLSKKNLNITENKGYKLSVKNTSKKAKIKWSSSDKKVVTVTASKNKKSATVNPVATTGSAIVTAKVGKKKYNCKVTVNIAKAENHFNDVKAAIEAKGVDHKFTGVLPIDIDTKAIITENKTVPVSFNGVNLDLTGNLFAAVPKAIQDTVAFGVEGSTTYMMSPYTGTAFFTLNKDKKIQYVVIDLKDKDGKDAIKVTNKAGSVIDATAFTKTAVPKDLADQLDVSGSAASMITDKSKAASALLQVLAKTDEDMKAKYDFGLASIGFDNYR